MDKKAWVHQLKKHVETRGADKAPWYVTWNDPDGKRRTKSCGPGKIGKTAATKLADTIHSQLVTGTYETKKKKSWNDFFEKYTEHVEQMYKPRSQLAALISLNTFVRIVKPTLVKSVTAQKIDAFVATRLKEKIHSKKNDTVRVISPATVNRELRYVRAALRLADDWGYIPKVPRIKFQKVPEKRPTFVPPEHFSAIIEACQVATIPSDIPNVSAPDWWRGLLVTTYMTGWRISQMRAVRREDTSLEKKTLLSRAEDNKGGRDTEIPLHPLVVKYIEPLMGSFSTMLFPWNEDEWALWAEFGRIQEAAKLADGSPMPKAGKRGSWYGFHDLRRGFATMNAGQMNLFELQGLMMHKSLTTTKGYVDMAANLNKAVSNLFVPDLRGSDAG